MHRLAPADVDVHFARSLEERPELAGAVRRLKRAVESGNEAAADAIVEEMQAIVGDKPPAGFERGIQEVLDGLSPQAYWRAATWRRIAVILAGPATNFLLAVVLFTCLFMTGGGKATTHRRLGAPEQAGGRDRPASPATRSSPSTACVVGPTDISTRDLGLEGQAGHRDGRARRAPVTLGPVRPDADRRRVPARLHRSAARSSASARRRGSRSS